jgi:hypothetical protein
MIRLLLPVLVTITAVAAPIAAQDTSEDASARASVTALFDAMRSGSADGVRAAFAPGARLQTVMIGPDGVAILRDEEVEAFAVAVGTPREQVWDERIDAWHVRVDGPLAVVTTDYSFYVDDRFSHCGINAIQLLRAADGWRIFQLVDTRRRAGCAGGG